MVGEDHVHRPAERATAMVLHRHAGRDDRAGPGEVGIRPGHIGQHAHPNDVVGNLLGGERGRQKPERNHERRGA
jgi:hypothetical protein